MSYYHMNFKFREPYQILVDEEIIIEASKTKYDLIQGFERTLQGQVKPLITQCAMEALYKSKNEQAISIAKKLERRRCGHRPLRDGEEADETNSGTKSAFDCMAELVNVNGKNKHRYVVATQKTRLRQLFRKVPAVPLVYINRSVMIMEPMSPVTERARALIEQSKLREGLNDTNKNDTDHNEIDITRKRKKGPKEPNPLSVKKKKTETVQTTEAKESNDNEEDSAKPKRKRRHKRSNNTVTNESNE